MRGVELVADAKLGIALSGEREPDPYLPLILVGRRSQVSTYGLQQRHQSRRRHQHCRSRIAGELLTYVFESLEAIVLRLQGKASQDSKRFPMKKLKTQWSSIATAQLPRA